MSFLPNTHNDISQQADERLHAIRHQLELLRAGFVHANHGEGLVKRQLPIFHFVMCQIQSQQPQMTLALWRVSIKRTACGRVVDEIVRVDGFRNGQFQVRAAD